MWTLVVEVQFYMILPLVFFVLKNASFKTSLFIITIVFLVIPVLAQAGTGASANFYPDINSHFPTTLSAFYLGLLIAGLDCQGLLKTRWANLGMVGVILWLLVYFFHGWSGSQPKFDGATYEITIGWVVTIASGFLLLYVANPRLLIARILCAPWLRWCGIISYELYLLHQPIILWNRKMFGPAEGNVFKYAAIVGGSFIFSAVLSALIYKFFSLPILKFSRRS